jgi:hypothetical protein
MAIQINNTTVIDDSRNILNIGIITATTINATSFVGNGSGLTGAGSTVSDDTSTNSTFYPLFTATTSGIVTSSKVSTTKLSFNPSTGTLSATKFSGDGSGLTGAGSTVSDNTTTNATFYPVLTQTTTGTITSSNVSTTKLSFNPSTGTLSATTFSGALTGTASTSTNATVTTSSTNSAFKVPFANTTANTTGNYGLLQDTETTFTYNPSTNTLTAGTFSGALSGTATTATSANTLTTARTINGVSFNGSANIDVNPTSGAFSNGQGAKVIQSGGTASGGSSGDIYYIY